MTESEAFQAAVDAFLRGEFGPRCTWKSICTLMENNGYRVVGLRPVNFRQAYAQKQPWALEAMRDLTNLINDLGFHILRFPIETCELAVKTERPDEMLRTLIDWFEKMFPGLMLRVAIGKKQAERGDLLRMVCGSPRGDE